VIWSFVTILSPVTVAFVIVADIQIVTSKRSTGSTVDFRIPTQFSKRLKQEVKISALKRRTDHTVYCLEFFDLSVHIKSRKRPIPIHRAFVTVDAELRAESG
jgi:hypothetical protein